MLTIESELTFAIYALYAIDCVHWLRPGQMALTRRLRGGWRTHQLQDDSYTLLGRMPVFVNPIDLRPSYLAGSIEELSTLRDSEHDLDQRFSADTRMLTMLSICGAINLLLLLPLLLDRKSVV